MRGELVGSYWVQADDGGASTVTGVRYRDMIENFLYPVKENRLQMKFQQNKATSRDTVSLLKQLFEKCPD